MSIMKLLKFDQWFPDDPVRLKAIARETFLRESSRFIFLLTLCIFVSALLLVIVKNGYHQEFIYLQNLKKQQESLHTTWMQLLIEEGTWGSYERINQFATDNNMASPVSSNIRILQVTPNTALFNKIKSTNLDSLVPTQTISAMDGTAQATT